jgi:hypothetical protein
MEAVVEGIIGGTSGEVREHGGKGGGGACG